MSREIKFRVWSLKYNQWMDHCGVVDCLGNLGSHFFIKHDDGRLEHGFVPLPKEENIIQQFTGLKDQNNREIYEGDILSDANGFTYRVFWYDALASFELDEIKEAPDEYPIKFFNYRDLRTLVVIGNELEHHFLL